MWGWQQQCHLRHRPHTLTPQCTQAQTEKFFFLGYREDAHSMPANANKDPRQVPAVSLFCKAALNSWGAILP